MASKVRSSRQQPPIIVFLLLELILCIQARTLVADSSEVRSLVEEDSEVSAYPSDPRRVARDPRFDEHRWDDGWDRGGWNDGGGWDEGGNWNEGGGWNNRPPWAGGGGDRRK